MWVPLQGAVQSDQHRPPGVPGWPRFHSLPFALQLWVVLLVVCPQELPPPAQVLALSPGSLAALNAADSGLCVSVKNKECADGSHPDNTGKVARHSKQPGFNLLQPSLADKILMSYVSFNLHHRHLPFSPDKISNKKGKGVVGEM